MHAGMYTCTHYACTPLSTLASGEFAAQCASEKLLVAATKLKQAVKGCHL